MTNLEQARSHFQAGEFGKAREAAVAALADSPDDPELLAVAGRAGVETGADDAVDQLRKVTELRADSAEAWHDLGDALATEGRDDEATEAFKKALELNPDDELALTHLGHNAYTTGKGDDALSYLTQAADRSEGRMSTAAISLVEMYRSLGQTEQALDAAKKVSEAAPDDVAAALDVAELSIELGNHDEAVKAFEHVRQIDEVDQHEVYALHGMIQVELARGDVAKALELAREAKAIDTVGRTTGVFAYLEHEAGSGGVDIPRDMSAATIEALEAPPTREEVDQALAASLREHHLSHTDDRHLAGEEPLG
ncbi:MAG: tetratricopeptide repeat protein [Thermoleophilaceae bacterium]